MDETTYMRDKWRCSACGKLNSLEYDNVCWHCLDKALQQDADKLREERDGIR